AVQPLRPHVGRQPGRPRARGGRARLLHAARALAAQAPVTRRTAAGWAALGAATVGLGWALGRLSVPSSYLFAALLLGLVVALKWPDRLAVPKPAFAAAQAVTGVTLGAYLQSKSLSAVAD